MLCIYAEAAEVRENTCPRKGVWGMPPKCLEFRSSEIASAHFFRHHTANIGAAVDRSVPCLWGLALHCDPSSSAFPPSLVPRLPPQKWGSQREPRTEATYM